MSEQNASARHGAPSPAEPTGTRQGPPTPRKRTSGCLPGHLEPPALLSRRSFLEQVPALVAWPAWAGAASGQGGAVREVSTAAQVLPCTRCAQCTARFCRYQVGEKQAAGL